MPVSIRAAVFLQRLALTCISEIRHDQLSGAQRLCRHSDIAADRPRPGFDPGDDGNEKMKKMYVQVTELCADVRLLTETQFERLKSRRTVLSHCSRLHARGFAPFTTTSHLSISNPRVFLRLLEPNGRRARPTFPAMAQPITLQIYTSDMGTENVKQDDASTWSIVATQAIHRGNPSPWDRLVIQGGLSEHALRRASDRDIFRVKQMYPRVGQPSGSRRCDDNVTEPQDNWAPFKVASASLG